MFKFEKGEIFEMFEESNEFNGIGVGDSVQET